MTFRFTQQLNFSWFYGMVGKMDGYDIHGKSVARKFVAEKYADANANTGGRRAQGRIVIV